MNTITPISFLQALFSGVADGYAELTMIGPPELHLFGPIVGWVQLPVSNFSEIHLEWIQRMNRQGFGAYYGLAVRRTKYDKIQRVSKAGKPYHVYPRGKALDASAITCLWADVDSTEPADLARLQAADPSITIASGGGYHGIWLLKAPYPVTDDNRGTIAQTLAGLALAVHGDPHVKDLARVFRLPGTINTKPQRNGARCEVAEWLPDLRYDFDDFDAYAKMAEAHDGPRVTRELPTGTHLELRAWVREYLEHGAPQGNRNARLFAAAVEYRANGYNRGDADRDLGGRAAADGLDDEEIQRTIESAWRSPVGQPNVPDYLRVSMAVEDRAVRNG